jgi:hypothetical protein
MPGSWRLVPVYRLYAMAIPKAALITFPSTGRRLTSGASFFSGCAPPEALVCKHGGQIARACVQEEIRRSRHDARPLDVGLVGPSLQ